MAQLQEEFDFYVQHQEEFAEAHRGQYVVIKDSQVLGFYDSEVEAVNTTQQNHDLGTFLVQLCEPGTENYTHVYHSRVVVV